MVSLGAKTRGLNSCKDALLFPPSRPSPALMVNNPDPMSNSPAPISSEDQEIALSKQDKHNIRYQSNC